MNHRAIRASGWAVHLAAAAGLAAGMAAAGADEGRLPAFPGAEGFGAASAGGRGGKVLHVTNLNDAGPGSFREALATKGPRIIVFDVGGSIEVKSALRSGRRNGRVTIAGQTAPGGITLVGGELWLLGYGPGPKEGDEDITVRHLRIRGVHNVARPGEGGNCIYATRARRVILDHCSVTGSTDTAYGMLGTVDATMQWCTLEEPALWGQGGHQHVEGDHNLGVQTAYGASRFTFHHNLFAHSSARNPMANDEPMDIRNNLVYHFGIGIILGNLTGPYVGAGRKPTDYDPTGSGYNIVGNYFREGPRRAGHLCPIYGPGRKRIYVRDNVIDMLDRKFTLDDPWEQFAPGKAPRIYWSPDRSLQFKQDKPLDMPAVKTDSAKDAYEAVLTGAGAWPRDATTRRIVEEVRSRAGEYGLSGPYEFFPTRTDGPTGEKFDADRDGMPDAWEAARGLDPRDPADGNRTVPRGASPNDRHAGYTYVEYYLNDLADRIEGVEGERCTVAAAVSGKGRIGCLHGGFTPGWASAASPREVYWGERNTFNKGSWTGMKALPGHGQVFSHWSGGPVEGSRDKAVRFRVEGDVKIVAHFAPDPQAGKPLTATFGREGGPKVEVKLVSHPGDFAGVTFGDSLTVGADGKVYFGLGDGQADSRLYRYDPGTGEIADLGAVQSALPRESRGKASHGRIQAPAVVAADGKAYFASHFAQVWGAELRPGGHLFRYEPGKGVTPLGTFAPETGCYWLGGDPARGTLHAVTSRNWRFLTYDLAAGAWRDKGAFTDLRDFSTPPFSVLADSRGNLYMPTVGEKGRWGVSRYDVKAGKFERADVVPGSLTVRGQTITYPWVAGAVDGDLAYVAVAISHGWSPAYKVCRVKLSDWPDIRFEELTKMDPAGRAIHAHNLALTRDRKHLVVAGKCLAGPEESRPFDGVWAYDLAAGKAHLAADITELLTRSFRDEDIPLHRNHYTGGAVDADGWIYVGVRKGLDEFNAKPTDVRLMAVRIVDRGR